jgi:hypothetical protein
MPVSEIANAAVSNFFMSILLAFEGMVCYGSGTGFFYNGKSN